ncbi:hypothetical protein K491DRAFT_717089 [Lophiostoma macrostomum CBS 122681]|uniref:Uncharacterized protein n=1 Tax=Lophiostoma macrostomum CBS 122681 TaxID=1314788 RepID=A0A6A6T337_9PLEO|nr:hypothetical protein K491DRAFT_717089 [Lophiostoma macrostomum CBS 122681]
MSGPSTNPTKKRGSLSREQTIMLEYWRDTIVNNSKLVWDPERVSKTEGEAKFQAEREKFLGVLSTREKVDFVAITRVWRDRRAFDDPKGRETLEACYFRIAYRMGIRPREIIQVAYEATGDAHPSVKGKLKNTEEWARDGLKKGQRERKAARDEMKRVKKEQEKADEAKAAAAEADAKDDMTDVDTEI